TVRLRLTDRRLAVRQEQDDGKMALGRRRTHGLAERAFDVRPARCVERGEIARRLTNVRVGRGNEVVLKSAHVTREIDQPKAIRGTQRGEQLSTRGPRLLDLATRHRTGDVEHERDV